MSSQKSHLSFCQQEKVETLSIKNYTGCQFLTQNSLNLLKYVSIILKP